MTIKIEDEVWTEEKLEYEMAWTSCAAKVESWRGIVHILKQEASESYVADRMEVAEAFKRLAKRIEKDVLARETDKLNKFIAEKGDGNVR